eukprot:6294675-Amphidinium_carterae.1
MAHTSLVRVGLGFCVTRKQTSRGRGFAQRMQTGLSAKRCIPNWLALAKALLSSAQNRSSSVAMVSGFRTGGWVLRRVPGLRTESFAHLRGSSVPFKEHHEPAAVEVPEAPVTDCTDSASPAVDPWDGNWRSVWIGDRMSILPLFWELFSE